MLPYAIWYPINSLSRSIKYIFFIWSIFNWNKIVSPDIAYTQCRARVCHGCLLNFSSDSARKLKGSGLARLGSARLGNFIARARSSWKIPAPTHHYKLGKYTKQSTLNFSKLYVDWWEFMSNNLSMSTKISNWCLQLNRRLDFKTSFAKVACKKCEFSLSAVTSWWRDY